MKNYFYYTHGNSKAWNMADKHTALETVGKSKRRSNRTELKRVEPRVKTST